MRITILGAGSWGTTVATLVCKRHDTLLWTRDAGIAEEINDKHHNQVYLLTAPNLAREILAGKAAATVIATENPSVATLLQGILRRGLLRVYTNDDVAGCELGGALKNVVAIAAGMAEGLGVGDNTRAAVITRGLAELTQLGVAMGGRAATFAGLTGLADLGSSTGS
ncbi:hypothetical protein [Nonomuraea zeae]|uniref:hypothetical protein n=1 Tax=Nonomuraea zeae TaxID=1642303 RepID=UPI0019809DFE|nr:hypothetical protein [Nonomuraea zeae]